MKLRYLSKFVSQDYKVLRAHYAQSCEVDSLKSRCCKHLPLKLRAKLNENLWATFEVLVINDLTVKVSNKGLTFWTTPSIMSDNHFFQFSYIHCVS